MDMGTHGLEVEAEMETGNRKDRRCCLRDMQMPKKERGRECEPGGSRVGGGRAKP